MKKLSKKNSLIIFLLIVVVAFVSLIIYYNSIQKEQIDESEQIEANQETEIIFDLPIFTESEVKSEVIVLFDKFKKDFTSKNTSNILDSFYNLTEKSTVNLYNFSGDINYSIRNSYIESVTLESITESKTKNTIIGTIEIKQDNCFKKPSLEINYNAELDQYLLTNTDLLFENLCTYQELLAQNPNLNIELNCIDCFLAPVDKIHSLSSLYIPEVVPIDVHGGGFMTQESKNALLRLIEDAQSKDIYPTLTSSYRSYNLQKSVFERWVRYEMNQGYSRQESEIRANVYSATPGNSEHQLGTTADMRCLTCEAFTSSQGNKILYAYLEENAHKFGFVISYSPNAQDQTGYKHEPWHIRYIGTELATELFERDYINSNGQEYPAKFLREKALY